MQWSNKWYAGLSAGATEIESDIVIWSGPGVTYSKQLERDFAYKIFGGYRLNDYLSIELSYNNFGEMGVSSNSGSYLSSEGVLWEFTQADSKLCAKVDSIALGINFSFPLKKITQKNHIKSITPFFRFGAHYWRVDKSLSPADSVNYYSQDSTIPPVVQISHMIENDSGLSWYYGVGFNVAIHKRITLSFAYEWYSIYEKMVDDADFISTSIAINF